MSLSFRLPSLLAAFGLMLLAGCAPNLPPPAAPSQPQPQAQPSAPLPAPGIAGGALTQPAPSQEAKVALLLPLSGPNAAVGRALMQAAEMGVFDSGDDNFNLVVRDSAAPGGPGVAVSSAMTEGARLVLGPLFASEVPDAARAAGSLVPVISFSNDRAAARPGVFVLGIAPQAQVERVVSYAAGQNLRRFAILYPSSAYGNAVRQAYQDAVTQSGGQIAMMQGYDPTATDFISTMQSLQSGYKSGGFDALMLPEGGQKLRALVAMLPGFDIPSTAAGAGGVRLLGTALWNDPSLTGDPNLSGAWFATTPPDRWASFAQRYQSVYGAPPDPRAGVVYDAVTLAVALAKAKPGGDFSVTRLTDVSGFAGVTGLFRLNPDGTSTRGLSVLEIAPGGITVRDPAPTTFQASIN
ncbi:MAG TPA: penicillin-binding protein activator [Dongiaceae bacterium]|jgi:ABC-type branched-subunit amino acid transport system substrate-binding protein|nr:penicillin-binding protein activator [Dongiaceae bacterium]